jgi:nucleoside phosphorylase
VAAKEAAVAATQDRYNQAAEALRVSWDRFKLEQDQFKELQQQQSEATAGDSENPGGCTEGDPQLY